MVTNDNPSLPHTYSSASTAVFWLFWLFGAATCLLFILFSFIMTTAVSMLAIWNLLIAIVQSFILTKSLRHFNIKKKPVSELLLWTIFAGIGVPLIGFGGCTIALNNFTLPNFH